MADLRNLRSKPLFSMSEQELETLLQERRASRRIPKKKVKAKSSSSPSKKTTKVKTSQLIESMSADQIKNLLSKLS